MTTDIFYLVTHEDAPIWLTASVVLSLGFLSGLLLGLGIRK